MTRRALVPALAVALAAFALYHATLLPGFDFGDTGSFQATVGSSIITTREPAVNIASVLANPMPDAAPVTAATLPSNSLAIGFYLAGLTTTHAAV